MIDPKIILRIFLYDKCYNVHVTKSLYLILTKISAYAFIKN